MATYPGAIVSFTPNVDDVTEVTAATVNVAYDEITAIETELGADIAGSESNLVTRLSRIMNGYGKLSFPDPTELTIASGSVTVTYNFHTLDTQSDAATDDLDTIIAPATGENWVVFFHIAADARNVVVRHNVGNIYCAGGRNITLDVTSDLLVAIYDNVIDKWIVTAQQIYINGTNTWTGYNLFMAGTGGVTDTIIADVTLDDTYRTMRVDCTAGNITVTLPAASDYPGIEYWIKHVGTANTVIIDGDGSETIDGSTTKTLSSQYTAVHIQSNGTTWDVL